MDYSTDDRASFLGKGGRALFGRSLSDEGSEAFQTFGFQGRNGLWSRKKSNQRFGGGICILRRAAGGGCKADIVVEFPRKRTENFDTGLRFIFYRQANLELARIRLRRISADV
jgi:hypothetical protein